MKLFDYCNAVVVMVGVAWEVDAVALPRVAKRESSSALAVAIFVNRSLVFLCSGIIEIS